jgi:hypothetical protein
MRTWRLDLDSDPHAALLVRHGLDDWLTLLDCTDTARQDIVVVASELVTAAFTSRARTISVRVLFDDGRLRMDVHGEGCEDGDGLPGDHGNGRSLSDRIIERASDNWGRRRDPDGLRLWADILC